MTVSQIGTVFVPGIPDGSGTDYGTVNQGGSYNVLARISSMNGTGSNVGVGEGNCLTQADVSSITCTVYDLGTNKDNPAGTPITPAPTLTPAANLFDTLRTTGWPVASDPYGWNFKHDLSPTYCPDAGHWYLVEYLFNVSASFMLGRFGTPVTEKVWLRVKVKTVAVQSAP